MLVGLLVWYLIGQPTGTWNLGVIFACNLIPLGSIVGGFIIGWRSGRDPIVEG
jgi:hypothetical protein